MTREKGIPDFNESDRSLFQIKDPRIRADRLKNEVVPKLKALFRSVTPALADCFGPSWMIDFKESFRPNHRNDAIKTQSFVDARFGFVKRQVDGKYFYIWLCFEITSEHLTVALETSRAAETTVLFALLKTHQEVVVDYLKEFDLHVGHLQNEEDIDDPQTVIESAQIDPSTKWHYGRIFSVVCDYPFASGEEIDELQTGFFVLFPFFQATCNLLNGIPDDLENLLFLSRNYLTENDAKATLESHAKDQSNSDADHEPVYTEGERIEYQGSRGVRDPRLRDAKIGRVLIETGELRCEIPGCDFDFFETYGERGKGFAIVHHRNPIGKRSGPSETKLSDLTIVCANCHAIIHRFDDDVSMDELISGAG
jgi:hypothetical protein